MAKKISQLPLATTTAGVVLSGVQGGISKGVPASLIVGTTAISGVSGLQAALDAKAPVSHQHSGTDLTTGTVPVGRLGISGTPSATSFLAGDNTWKVPAGGSATTNAAALTSGTLAVARLGTSGTRDGTTYLAGDNTFKPMLTAAMLETMLSSSTIIANLMARISVLESGTTPANDTQVTWSATNKSARVAVSPGDTATLTNQTGAQASFDYAYADAPIPAAGKWVLAIQNASANGPETPAFGIRNTGFDFNSKFGWTDTSNAIVIIYGDGDVHSDGVQVGEFQANQKNFSDRDLIIAGDSTARKFWVGLKGGDGSIYWNIDSGANPATGTGGYPMPASFNGSQRLFFQAPFTPAGGSYTAKIVSKVADIAAAYPGAVLTGFSSLGGVLWSASSGGGTTPPVNTGDGGTADPTSYTATQLRSYNIGGATTETVSTGNTRTMRAHDLWSVQGFNCKLDESQHNTNFDTVVLPRVLGQNPGKIRTVIPIRARQASDAAYQLEIDRNRAMCAKGAKLVINALTPLDLEPDRVNSPQTVAQMAARAFQLILDIGPEYVAIVEGMNEVNLNEWRFDPSFTQQQKGQRLADVHRAAFQLLRNDSRTSSILVAAPSISGANTFWEGVVNGLSDAYDLGNLRWYQGTRPPWTPAFGSDDYGSLTKFARDTIAHANGKVGMVITETGYHNAIGNPTHSHRPVAEQVSRAYEPLISPWALEMASLNLGAGAGARAITKYSFRDIANNINDAEMSFGLMRFSPAEMKPAAVAAARLANVMYDPGPMVTLSAVPAFTVTAPSGADVKSRAYKKRSGKFYVVLWDARFISDVSEPGGVYNVNSYTWYGKANATVNIAATDIKVYPLDPGVASAPVTAAKSGNNFTIPGFGQDAVVLEITL